MGPEVLVPALTVGASVLTALITGIVTYSVGAKNARVTERQASTEAQKTVNEAFRLLVEGLQEERRELRLEVQELRQRCDATDAYVGRLEDHFARLEAELVKSGVAVPPRPVRAAKRAIL